MKSLLRLSLLAAALLTATAGLFARANTVENLRDATAAMPDEKERLSVQSALLEFEGSDRLKEFFAKSYGVVIFPTVGKGGLGIGGAHGTGWGFREGRYDGESKMTQVTIGFQAGGQAFSQIIFFEDEFTFNRFTNGNFELGAQASAVAITVGANAQASTAGGANAGAHQTQAKSTYSDGLAIFTLAKGGLMYEASVGGQKFSYRPAKK